jgi:phosphatidylethanolamine-binding protein (PEBP) family uncharacterized protein
MKNIGILFSAFVTTLVFLGCQTREVAPDAVQLDVSFEWPTKSGCSDVSPAMSVGNIPASTKFLEIKLKDLDKPGFDHGGGVVSFAGSGEIPAGAIPRRYYTGPCPPFGSHTYEISVSALGDDRSKVLGNGSATRKYPE